MSNERYKAMIAVRNAAVLELPPIALTVISPAAHGKTETKKAFLTAYDDCYEITSMSDSALGDELLELANAHVVVIDDPLNWDRVDFMNAVRYLKNLHGGAIISPRKTKFKRDNIAVPANIHTIMLMHSKQWNEVQMCYAQTGFEERALMCWSTHSKETMRNIGDIYMNRKHTSLPLKFDTSDFELLKYQRELTGDEREWIEKNHLPIQSASSMARAISIPSFETLKPYLASNSRRIMFIEEIKYESQ
jgi:hypothetical protein